jgi:hypothetical protein
MSSNPYEVVVIGDASSPDDCLRGLLQVVLDSTANQITTILDIISEKYKISREDLSYVVRDDKRFSAVLKEKLGPVVQMKTTTGKTVVVKKKIQPKSNEPL